MRYVVHVWNELIQNFTCEMLMFKTCISHKKSGIFVRVTLGCSPIRSEFFCPHLGFRYSSTFSFIFNLYVSVVVVVRDKSLKSHLHMRYITCRHWSVTDCDLFLVWKELVKILDQNFSLEKLRLLQILKIILIDWLIDWLIDSLIETLIVDVFNYIKLNWDTI